MITLVVIFTSILLLTGLLNDIKIVFKGTDTLSVVLSITLTTLCRIAAALVIVMGGFILIGGIILLTGNKSKE